MEVSSPRTVPLDHIDLRLSSEAQIKSNPCISSDDRTVVSEIPQTLCAALCVELRNVYSSVVCCNVLYSIVQCCEQLNNGMVSSVQ